jgi:putative Mn2+ efflux pump MntP
VGFTELFLIGIGLSMDAFAVAICRGLAMPRFSAKQALIIGLFFGGFQALMPTLGWLLGSQFASMIQHIDHWIAFVLLALIGGNMIREALGDDDDEPVSGSEQSLDYIQLLMMAVATSIDALAVGVTFAFLDVKIAPAVAIIGVTTLVLSFVGVAVGNHFGALYKRRAEICGGVILVLLGLKILVEHLGLL